MYGSLIVLGLVLATGVMSFPKKEGHIPLRFPWAVSQGKNATKNEERSDWDSCDCGTSPLGDPTRIMGGRNAEVGEFPWVVGLIIEMQTDSGEVSGYECGGTIISPDYIMSAAHCLTADPGEKLKTILIYAGATGNQDGTAYEAESHIIGDYNPMGFINDIVLIKVKGGISFNQNVKPACMPSGFPDGWTGKVWSSGWGIQESGASPATELQKAVLTVIPNGECSEMYFGSPIPDEHVCTYDEGKTTCTGDSGSPLSVKLNDGKWAALGIVSYGVGNCNPAMPAVYTRVASYISWLEANTGETFCKK